jgi:hypothetical protein
MAARVWARRVGKQLMGVGMPAVEAMLASGRVGDPHPVWLELSRKSLPAICAARGYTSGAEIGVWYGKFSEAFCRANPDLHMLCVDSWTSYDGWWDSKNQGDVQRTMADAYASARERLTPYRCTIHRGFSADVAPTIADRSLDFVFIDGNHSYEAVKEDLRLWCPKVKVGGLVIGHDYHVNTAKPFLQVKRAVDEYVAANQITPWYVLGRDRTPSFLWVAR